MPDEITGVLVLQKMPSPPEGIYRIWFQYTRADGIIGYSSIPMIEEGNPEPAVKNGPLWRFRRDNPWLHCSPSVRILGPKDGDADRFHNAGIWQNHYVEHAYPFGGEPEGKFDSDLLVIKINKEPTKEERDAVIMGLRGQGILL